MLEREPEDAARRGPESQQQPDDASLVAAARAGDQQAFAALYERYAGPVHDFLARMLRDRTEAEDVTQDTFMRAMQGLGGLQQGTSFRGWLFTIARNTALNRIERSRRVRPLALAGDGEDGEQHELDVVDTDRLADPQEAAGSAAVAALVWEAAAALNPKEYSLLDLHLRQGLDSGEIADVLGVTRNNAYVMLNRLRHSVEGSIGAYVMMHAGRAHCPQLDADLRRAGVSALSPAVRRTIDRHVAGCDVCRRQKEQLASPLAILGAFAPIPLAPGAHERILADLMAQWPPTPAPVEPAASAPAQRSTSALRTQRSLALLAVVLGLLLLLVLPPGSPLSGRFFGSDEPATLSMRLTGTQAVPLGGVVVTLHPAAGGAALRLGTTAADGTLIWDNLPAGDYLVVIAELPAELQGDPAGLSRPVTLRAGEAVDLDAAFQVLSE